MPHSLPVNEGDRTNMNLKGLLRTSILGLLVGLVVVGLASCQLPASQGPQTPTGSNSGFPVPGVTKTTSGIDISVFATQTAQAMPPVEVPTGSSNPYPAPTSESPIGTAIPTTIGVEPTATQAPAPITYVTATPGGPPATITLAEGEFAYCIARRFNVNIDELLSLNGLTLDSMLSPGDELKIPQTGNPFMGERMLHEHPSTYKIRAGDTLNSIACYYGDISPDLIALQNNLTSYTDLPVGETLIIP
jgi:LysM repeat protein